MRVMVALCLATEDYARSFLVILENQNPRSFGDLVERGPQGKMERASSLDASDSEGQKRVTEQGVRRTVTSVYPEPQNHGRIAILRATSVRAGRADTATDHSHLEETTRSRCPCWRETRIACLSTPGGRFCEKPGAGARKPGAQ
ncbi:hypothetical protein Q5P01_000347 [Channa striata]|uniref:Uncharacterized protein n=1 Tax=Channa striata TaxID=64152 RepID=A0AA88IZD3_CHASR|nr:hypothetical protein Q5P01_000347 [Channa striata]